MRVVLDLDKLLAQGRITPAQYEEIKALAEAKAGNLAINILLGFGVWAIALGALTWLNSAMASIQIGLILTSLGIYLKIRYSRPWGSFAQMLLLVGTLMSAGGIVAFTKGSVGGFLLITALLVVGTILAKSGLLSALSALSLSATIGAMTAYDHASYYLIIQQPSLTIALFAILGWLSYQLSKRVSEDYEGLGIIFARTCLFLVNFGFWIGSLWGDSLGQSRDVWGFGKDAIISDETFVIAWALALLGGVIWGIRQHRMWVVNTLTVFGAIHFYTQYFERLGAHPLTLMLGGIIALIIVLGLFRYNRG